jgi:hypothetical protein
VLNIINYMLTILQGKSSGMGLSGRQTEILRGRCMFKWGHVFVLLPDFWFDSMCAHDVYRMTRRVPSSQSLNRFHGFLSG